MREEKEKEEKVEEKEKKEKEEEEEEEEEEERRKRSSDNLMRPSTCSSFIRYTCNKCELNCTSLNRNTTVHDRPYITSLEWKEGKGRQNRMWRGKG